VHGGANMPTKIAISEKILLSLEETAALTSSSVSWWRQAVRGEKPMPGGIRALKIGKCWKISRESLESWIRGGAQQPQDRKRGRPRKAEQQGS